MGSDSPAATPPPVSPQRNWGCWADKGVWRRQVLSQVLQRAAHSRDRTLHPGFPEPPDFTLYI